MHEPYDLGLLIKKLRQEAGMSQKELGEKINRDKGIISRYEANYQTPSFETMRELAVIFNVSMDYLAGFDKSGTIQAFGLSDDQREILKDTAEILRLQNMKKLPKDSLDKYKLLGKITACFFENSIMLYNVYI